MIIFRNFFNCGRLNLEKIILNLRIGKIIDKRLSIEEISKYLEDEYKFVIFKGDLIDYFENLIYSLESIKSISEGIVLEQKFKKEIENFRHLIDKIKN